ncbi:MAG: hypothetical protein WAZ34_08565 [Rhodocyclaceae bacterium]
MRSESEVVESPDGNPAVVEEAVDHGLQIEVFQHGVLPGACFDT